MSSRVHIPAQRSSGSEDLNDQHEEHQNDQRERHHHSDALKVATLYLLIVGLQVLQAELRALPCRPQLAVAVSRRRLVQLSFR